MEDDVNTRSTNMKVTGNCRIPNRCNKTLGARNIFQRNNVNMQMLISFCKLYFEEDYYTII
jgi:hypothetical protein